MEGKEFDKNRQWEEPGRFGHHQNFEEGVSDSHWAEIQNRLKKGKHRGIIWWCLGSAGLASILFLSFWLWNPVEKLDQAENQKIVQRDPGMAQTKKESNPGKPHSEKPVGQLIRPDVRLSSDISEKPSDVEWAEAYKGQTQASRNTEKKSQVEKRKVDEKNNELIFVENNGRKGRKRNLVLHKNEAVAFAKDAELTFKIKKESEYQANEGRMKEEKSERNLEPPSQANPSEPANPGSVPTLAKEWKAEEKQAKIDSQRVKKPDSLAENNAKTAKDSIKKRNKKSFWAWGIQAGIMQQNVQMRQAPAQVEIRSEDVPPAFSGRLSLDRNWQLLPGLDFDLQIFGQLFHQQSRAKLATQNQYAFGKDSLQIQVNKPLGAIQNFSRTSFRPGLGAVVSWKSSSFPLGIMGQFSFSRYALDWKNGIFMPQANPQYWMGMGMWLPMGEKRRLYLDCSRLNWKENGLPLPFSNQTRNWIFSIGLRSEL